MPALKFYGWLHLIANTAILGNFATLKLHRNPNKQLSIFPKTLINLLLAGYRRMNLISLIIIDFRCFSETLAGHYKADTNCYSVEAAVNTNRAAAKNA